MRLYTPDGLLYPITVTKLLHKPGDEIDINASLFYYEYKSVREEWDDDKRENVQRERTWPATFESELEGKLESLNVQVGQVIERRTAVAEVEEPCKHETQWQGMCVDCCKDMTEKSSYNETTTRVSRATVNTVHGRTDLKVSMEVATQADEEAKRRLLDSRRLSLVVDLDQTIIHASVEPTIGEWQNDPTNPNYDALKDVQKFQLADDKPNTWYYIKPRPGLPEFLSTLSEIYEMHIYTMGTRAYAENVAKIIDPQRKIFGDRILSRDESGSMTAKNLKRLFPVDTKMVVIIDDRADVWHWIDNLIKVNVFEFFVGIGDINSSFLPKRPELEAAKAHAPKMERSPSKKTTSESESSDAAAEGTTAVSSPSTALSKPPATNGEGSAVEQRLMSMAGTEDEKSLQEKTEEQEQTIQEQLDDRPMLKKQKELEDLAKEEEAQASPAVEAAAELLAENSNTSETTPQDTVHHKYRQNLLANDDTELVYLEQSLRSVHRAYYEEYEKIAVAAKGGRVAELRPGQSKKLSAHELEHIPDAASIMVGLKHKVLAGVHLVFSGVVPLGINIYSHDAALWARSFGAEVRENITKRTTHVIASPERRTAKVRQAAKKSGRIAIVSLSWLHACFAQWKRVDENPYRIHSDAPTNGSGALPESFEHKDFILSSSDEEAAETDDESEDTETDGSDNSLKIDTDTEELLKFAPSMDRQDSSPTETEVADDWEGLNDELAEFLDTDDEGASDNESTRSDATELMDVPSRKRKQAEVENAGDEEGSRLQKRKREALERTTSLNKIAVPSSNGSATNGDGNVGDDSDDDDELAAAMAEEMERQDAEEEAEGAS